MMYLKIAKKVLCAAICCTPTIVEASSPSDSLFLTLDRLFEWGVEHNLQLKADRIQLEMAEERIKTASSMKLPDIQIGLKGGVLGQPVVFEHGLSDATYPDTPDWSQNYAVDFTQPLYEGGKIRYAVKKAQLEHQAVSLQTDAHRAALKLDLLEKYMSLFSLYKQHEILSRQIEESELRLFDIRRMKREGLITNNDVLRSEMQLTRDRLSLTEVENNIRLFSQQLTILLGIKEDYLLKPDTTLFSMPVLLEDYEAYWEEAYREEPSLKWLRKQTVLHRFLKYLFMHQIHWHDLYRVQWPICIIITGTLVFLCRIRCLRFIRTIIRRKRVGWLFMLVRMRRNFNCNICV